MQIRRKHICIALGCILLLSGVVLLLNVRAQAPEKAQIAFISDRDGNFEIYVVDAGGIKEPLRLTNNPGSDRSPSWSPDGGKIVFHSDRHGNYEIYVMHADGVGSTAQSKDRAMDHT